MCEERERERERERKEREITRKTGGEEREGRGIYTSVDRDIDKQDKQRDIETLINKIQRDIETLINKKNREI